MEKTKKTVVRKQVKEQTSFNATEAAAGHAILLAQGTGLYSLVSKFSSYAYMRIDLIHNFVI